MRIEINENGAVDFESPVYMNDKQLKIFLDGMEKIFGKVQEHEKEELDKEMSGIERHPKKWTSEELIYLISDKTHEEIGNILKREPFSVKSKRGVWLLPFTTWAKKNGYFKNGKIINPKGVIEAYEKNRE